MSIDKQIEEMVKDLENHTCMSEYQAEIASRMLYIKGYRKASDVAREIFEEIEKLMNKLDKRHIACGNPKQAWGVRSAMTELAELKKKYESEVK